jgi:ribosomal protein S18 acetylase RimI-like enzyme
VRVVCRLASLEDLDDLCALDELVFGGPEHSHLDRTGRRQFKYQLTKAHAEIYVTEVDGRIVGFATVLMRRGSGVVRGYSVGIAPDLQNMGVASAFFAWAEHRWVELGYDRASIEVHVDNEGAQRLYGRMDYHITERMPDYFGAGDDAVRMVKQLSTV